MNNLIILGRGVSLNKLMNIENKNFEYVVLVNCFWDSIQSPVAYYKINYIHNFIKDKKIILICSPCCDFSKINYFIDKYNVVNCFKTLFSEGEYRLGKDEDVFKTLPNKLIEPYKFISEQGDKFKNLGSLSMAILYSINELNFKDIYICGLDFYEKDYLIKQTHNYRNEVLKSKIIKQNWFNFFLFYKDIKFYLYTYADISEFNIDNLIVL